MSTPLVATWLGHESFREAVRTATTWRPEGLARITDEDVEDFPSVQPRLSELGPNPELLLALVNFLRGSLYDYPSVDAMLADLRDLVDADDEMEAADFDAISESLRALLPATPEAARDYIRQVVQHSVNPFLTGVEGAVDFRAVQEAQSGKVRFVPLGHLRLVLDEPTRTGGEAVTFQVAPAELDALAQEIDRMKSLLHSAEQAIGKLAF